MTTKTTTEVAIPAVIDLAVSGSLDPATRDTIDRLSHAIQHQHGKCDAIGECGRKCSLRAGHPGDIHEGFEHGTAYRFRLSGPLISQTDSWGRFIVA